MTASHPDYAPLAARIVVSNLQKNTKKSFSDTIKIMYDHFSERSGLKAPLIADDVYEIIMKDTARPTSNPFPPNSEAFASNQNLFLSAQDAIESVAQQVPNFGIEQDKAHCPFHLKTGACRFGQRCSRVHFYPDKASTLLIKDMYTGIGFA